MRTWHPLLMDLDDVNASLKSPSVWNDGSQFVVTSSDRSQYILKGNSVEIVVWPHGLQYIVWMPDANVKVVVSITESNNPDILKLNFHCYGPLLNDHFTSN